MLAPSPSLLVSSQPSTAMYCHLRFMHSIGGLVVKLAVANRSPRLQMISASPGFDSRPMHVRSQRAVFLLLLVCLIFSAWKKTRRCQLIWQVRCRRLFRSAGLLLMRRRDLDYLDTVCSNLCLGSDSFYVLLGQHVDHEYQYHLCHHPILDWTSAHETFSTYRTQKNSAS
jgi:hypothetical protein